MAAGPRTRGVRRRVHVMRWLCGGTALQLRKGSPRKVQSLPWNPRQDPPPVWLARGTARRESLP